MNREEVFLSVQAMHDTRMDRACKRITDTDTGGHARTELEIAVRSLSGVSGDPDTVPDIMRLMDTYISRLTSAQDGTDTCWISGPHRAHTWPSAGRTYRCQGTS